MKQQNFKKSVDSYLSNIIEESVKATLQRRALQEKEKQDAASSEVKPVESVPEKEKLKSGDINVDDIIEKLNSIRSGKSFKDEKISSALAKYFDSLDKAEKVALLAFLKGISQIVTGEVSPTAAVEPSTKPAGVEMEKTTGDRKVSIKPNVIKAPDIEKEKKKSSSEDTSGPVPIKPKK